VAALGPAAGLTLAYVLLRLLGRIAGGWLGSLGSSGDSASTRMVGVALLPQAGIAIGMALVVSERVPEVGDVILTATVAGTIVFEVVGPILTRLVVLRSGETNETGETDQAEEV